MTTRIVDNPDYDCEVCNSPMTEATVKYRTFLNNRQYVFCSIGCYYTWAEGADDPYGDEEYRTGYEE
jgi:hypothetical protein